MKVTYMPWNFLILSFHAINLNKKKRFKGYCFSVTLHRKTKTLKLSITLAILYFKLKLQKGSICFLQQLPGSAVRFFRITYEGCFCFHFIEDRTLFLHYSQTRGKIYVVHSCSLSLEIAILDMLTLIQIVNFLALILQFLMRTSWFGSVI